MTKYFILDTNVILSSGSGGGSKVLYGFQSGKDSNVVVITGTVLQELDNKKTAPGEIGYNARDFIRALDDLRAKGDLTKGVILEKGAVMVEPDGVDANLLPVGFSLDRADNRIISTCIFLAKKYPKQRFVYVSNDVSCRCNADICFRAAGVKVAIEGYKNDRIDSDEEYKGYEIINDRECPGLVQALFEDTENNGVPIENSGGLYENEYLYFEESKIVTVYQDGRLYQIHEPSVFGLNRLYNPQQIMAMHALLAPPSQIPLVVLTGSAGSGKTFLPVAAGIDQIYGAKDRRYDRMIISRSNSLSKDEDLGFLPGDVDEKMEPLIQPVRDSIENLLRVKHGGRREDRTSIIQQVDDIFETTIDILPMKYIRGRSFVNKFVLLDEAQNITRKQAFDVLTRAGEGCKIVMVGDCEQIDNPYLDQYTSGLTFVKDRMRGKGAAIVSFGKQEIVRSTLARMAAERMKG